MYSTSFLKDPPPKPTICVYLSWGTNYDKGDKLSYYDLFTVTQQWKNYEQNLEMVFQERDLLMDVTTPTQIMGHVNKRDGSGFFFFPAAAKVDEKC